MKHAVAAALLALALMPAATTAFAQEARERCLDCVAPREHYDSQEIVRTRRDVDRSRVINTSSEVITRVRYAVRVPVVTTVNFVVNRYRVVEMPNTVLVPISQPPARECYRGRRGYGSCRPLRVRG